MTTRLMLAVLLVMGSATSSFASAAPRGEKSTKVTKVVSLPRLLELGADRCVPCKMMQPILAELRQDFAGKVQVDFIDVWKNPNEAEKYQVRSIPTQVFFDRSGKEVFRHIGFYPKPAIVSKLREMGVK